MGPQYQYQFSGQRLYDRISDQNLPNKIYYLIECLANILRCQSPINFFYIYIYMSFSLYRKNTLNI